MNNDIDMGRRAVLGALALAIVGGCGGDGDMPVVTPPPAPPPPPPVPPPAVTHFTVTNLVADAAGAAHTDANLVNAWGIAFNPQGFVWVSAAGTDKSTLYDGNGVPQTLVVATPPEPTGIVFNSTQDFKVTQNGVTGASPFIFATGSGRIAGWSPAVNRTAAVQVVDASTAGKAYKGLAIGNVNGTNYIYATDFYNDTIDVYDGSFARATLPGTWRDPGIAAGYAPFGIQAIGDRLYVTYAKRAAGGDEEVTGAGFGFVSVFDMAGNFVRQVAAGGALNAPWGLALAPANFGTFSGRLLVANFGDGRLNAYDLASGRSEALTKADGSPIVVDGLWGLAFGNGLNAQPVNTLFFTAGPGDETHGLYGRVDMV